MYEFDYTARFLRDIKRLKRKHVDMSRLDDVLDALGQHDTSILKTRFRDHQLKGGLSEYRELHVDSDWLLVYRVDGARLTITLVRTGSHDDLLP